MIGTILNAAAILVGSAVGLTTTRQLSATTQSRLRIGLGAFTVWIGISLSWSGLNGTFRQITKQFVIVLLALTLGKILGQVLRLQPALNCLGHYAKLQFATAQSGTRPRFSHGFVTCTILFCVGPIAILGALQDGLLEDFRTLAVKALMDGLAMVAFAKTFGWSASLAALPVFAYQGTLTLLAQAIAPYLKNHALLDSLSATGGLLVFCVGLIILELKKVELANYLPSLVLAPVLTWLWQ